MFEERRNLTELDSGNLRLAIPLVFILLMLTALACGDKNTYVPPPPPR